MRAVFHMRYQFIHVQRTSVSWERGLLPQDRRFVQRPHQHPSGTNVCFLIGVLWSFLAAETHRFDCSCALQDYDNRRWYSSHSVECMAVDFGSPPYLNTYFCIFRWTCTNNIIITVIVSNNTFHCRKVGEGSLRFQILSVFSWSLYSSANQVSFSCD